MVVKRNCTYNLLKINKPATGMVRKIQPKVTFIEGRETEGAYLSAATNCATICERKDSFCPVEIQGLNFITKLDTTSKKWTNISRTNKATSNGHVVTYWEGFKQQPNIDNLALCSQSTLLNGMISIGPTGSVFPGVNLDRFFNGATLVCVLDVSSYEFNPLDQSYFILQTTRNNEVDVNREMMIYLTSRMAFGIKEDDAGSTTTGITCFSSNNDKLVLVISFINNRIYFHINGISSSFRSLSVSEWDSFSCVINNHEDSTNNVKIEELYLFYGGLNNNVKTFIGDLYEKHDIITPSQITDKIVCYTYEDPSTVVSHVDPLDYDNVVPLRDMEINVTYDHNDFSENGYGVLLVFKAISPYIDIINVELDPTPSFSLSRSPLNHVYSFDEEPLDSTNIITVNTTVVGTYSGEATLTFRNTKTKVVESITIPCQIEIT